MKRIGLALFVLCFTYFPYISFGQLWKQYSDSAKILYGQDKYSAAIELFNKAKDELQKDSIGTVSYATVWNNIGLVNFQAADYPQADSAMLIVKQLWVNLYGKEHPKFIAACSLLAQICYNMEQYDRAESYYIETRELQAKILGKNDPGYASTCKGLGDLYRATSKFQKAETLYLETKDLRERNSGKESSEFANACNDLGLLYESMDQYQKSEFYYLESKQVRDKIGDQENINYAFVENNLGDLYADMGLYNKAEHFYIAAKIKLENYYGKEHPNYGQVCYNLGIFYDELGDHEKAEALLLESGKIFEASLSRESTSYATNCLGLAQTYKYMGQYRKAESLYLIAIQIIEKLKGRQNLDYVAAGENLATLYTEKNEFDKSEKLLLETRRQIDELSGKNNAHYALNCHSLGVLYQNMRKPDKAEQFFLEAKEIKEKVYGETNFNCVSTYISLGNLYRQTGRYKEAVIILLKSKDIIDSTFGKDQEVYTTCMENLAKSYWGLAQFDYAESCYKDEFSSETNEIDKIFKFTTEKEKDAFLKKSANLSTLYSFDVSANRHSFDGLAYDYSISNRNIILYSSAQVRKNILFGNNKSLDDKYNSWISTREQLAFWYSKPIARRPPYLKDLEDSSNKIEKQLVSASSGLNQKHLLTTISWTDIRSSLKANEASIEFVEFPYYNGERYTDSIFCMAILIRKDAVTPVSIKLFEVKQLDLLLSDRSASVTDNISALYSRGAGIIKNSTSGNSIYKLVWQPIEKYLKGIDKVYFAPAGSLYRISFAAIAIDKHHVLSDKYQLVQLSTTSSLSDAPAVSINVSDKIYLYGGVQYDADSVSMKNAVSFTKFKYAGTRSLPEDLKRGDTWRYLPGTEEEVKEIGEIGSGSKFNITIYRGTNATEESLKMMNGELSPAILHIASHGFFFPDPKTETTDKFINDSESGKIFRQSEDPLLRSGVLLSGANNAWRGNPIQGIEDGILTSYEVSNLFLPNTKLVVLSACETGLGDIQGSEGVYGLQRAFKMAGAEYLIMSLWKVPDEETKEFMSLFYRNLFAGNSISKAFRTAQTTMKNKFRETPYKWAAWILVR